jgi:hypothetical protein
MARSRHRWEIEDFPATWLRVMTQILVEFLGGESGVSSPSPE